MKILNGEENQVINHIFSGNYQVGITGKRGRYYQFSSPNFPISLFSSPFDAYLPKPSPTGEKILAVGERLRRGCEPTSERTGSLYFHSTVNLIGTCHGYGHDDDTYYHGYNFYQAFYPGGYFIPPYGENISVFLANQDGSTNLANGNCNNLNVTEYNELFGIVSKTTNDSELLSSTLSRNTFFPIFSPREICPPEVASTSYYNEFQFKHIPGTTKALGGINHFNGNPIPTSLDSFDIKVNKRYEQTTEGDINYIVFEGGKPNPSYSTSDETNKLNNNLCQATLLETKVSSNRGSNGVQLATAPDASQGEIGDQVSFAGAEHFHYWHFTFQENAETLPFYNNFADIGGDTLRIRKLNEGTQLFQPILSSDDYFWKNRQCPDVVDYLPHTFGTSIYACPSNHFDVPYYAALRKFGFYGTRFLNSCKKLNLTSDWSGVENASELPESEENYSLGEDGQEPDVDADGSWSFPAYTNLLKVAGAEERYANMYALNKGFFLWANTGYLTQEPNFISLNTTNPAFRVIFESLINKFEESFNSGMVSFTGEEPTVLLKRVQNAFVVITSGSNSELLSTNDEYNRFRKKVELALTGINELVVWDELESRYANYVSNGTSVNEDFYERIISGKEKRIRTRYFENLIRGNPIDLFPINNISFSFDRAQDYLEHTGWSRKTESFGANSDLPEVNRRYFEGAYGQSSSISGLMGKLNNVSNTDLDYYFPGYFNDKRIDKVIPVGKYEKVVSGLILDDQKRSFSPSGWLALGYNEIGKLDGNFSCFTPIWIQQPLPQTFCKIGQHPTLRALAVDYHTIPEDKISRRYPEIIYWCHKLKLLDCNGKNLYPLKYKWMRIKKSSYDEVLARGSFFQSGEFASQSGNWGCIEGDGSDCTVFHPLDSFPVFTGVTSATDYTFIKGAIKNIDDDYYYFSTVSGRFGVRISNPTELYIEDWLKFDMSVKNGLNAPGSVSIKFEINDYEGATRSIVFEGDGTLPNYGGYEQDSFAIPETVIEQKIPPPNAGYGDVTAFRFIGPNGYIGASRSFTPSRLTDTRGLRETWGHFLDYGQLVSFSKILNQNQADWLYGYKHLPTCENYEMTDGNKGVKVIPMLNGNLVSHWALEQKAIISLDMKAGVQWDRLTNLGELYPPSNNRLDNIFPNFGIGHWQWGNNLGAIKRFGKNSTRKDIRFVGGSFVSPQSIKDKAVEEVKEAFVGPSELAGDNCGYNEYGLGRNMIYYLEAFERFYIICDPLKKKNVSNKTFLCPGIRMNNSAIQYFWMGQPSNTYVKRRPMYGPYAYQWRVERHNRDRNGNGISEGFYSMGHQRKYSLLYDAPAIYGLYVKTKTNSQYKTSVTRIKNKRNELNQRYGLYSNSLREVWFGLMGEEGTSRRYGDITFSCSSADGSYDDRICEYVSLSQSLATNMNFSDYKCPEDLLSIGACFDPCISMRYAQGFFPGGKALDLFGYSTENHINEVNDKNVRLVPLLTKDSIGTKRLSDEILDPNSNIKFRSPINTPHARITRGIKPIGGSQLERQEIIGVSTCQDGGSDHCNYITPTIHLGLSSYLVGEGNVFTVLKKYAAELYNADYVVRGEVM